MGIVGVTSTPAFSPVLFATSVAANVSVPSGLCGPCVSIDPIGRIATSVLLKASFASSQLMSDSKYFKILHAPNEYRIIDL